MAEDRDTEARWYVVHTYSGYENKVAQNLETIVENRRLQELIHEVKVPVELVPDIKDGKEREVERKLFPGYVLVKMVMTARRPSPSPSPTRKWISWAWTCAK